MPITRILDLVKKHERLRSNGINLIASENFLSENVRQVLASDLAGRYHTEWYGGSRFAREIIETTESLARRLFRVKHVIVTPLSGNICDLTALFAFTSPGDRIAMVSFNVGGYPLGAGKFNRELVPLPFDEANFEIDVGRAEKLIAEKNVKLTILGSSFILFPQPVRELSRFIKDSLPSCRCVYDGAHVLGLIACGEFQDPIREGAEVLFGSTHKSFYGPQGGMILTNSAEHAENMRNFLEIDLENGIGLVDNPHMNRVAALGVALGEMLSDRSYGKSVIRNAKALAHALDDSGMPVKYKERGYTESHQLLLDIDPKLAEEFCRKLEKVGIFIDVGGRLGVAEVTHRGFGESDMDRIAEVMAEVYHKGVRKNVRKLVMRLAGSVQKKS